MAADCAFELKSSGVTMLSLWPGAVKTELVNSSILEKEPVTSEDERAIKLFEKAESVEFAGKSIRYLAADTNVINKTGKILMTLVCLDNTVAVGGTYWLMSALFTLEKAQKSAH